MGPHGSLYAGGLVLHSLSEDPLRYAATLIERCPDSVFKQWALAHLASAAARHGDCADALSILAKVTQLEPRFSALEVLVHSCPELRGFVKELRAILPQLEPASFVAREEPGALFSVCLDSRLFDDALEICEAYTDAFDQSWALAELAVRMASSGLKDRVPRLLERAHSLSAGIENGEDRDAVLSEIANVYAASGMDAEWRMIVDSIQLLEYRLPPLIAAAAHSGPALDELIATAHSILNGPDAASNASSIKGPIKLCLELGEFDDALQLVRSMPEGVWKERGQLEICGALVKGQEFDRCREFVGEIRSSWVQAHSLSLLAMAYRKAGDMAATTEILHACIGRLQNAELPEGCHRGDVSWILDLSALLARNGLNEESERVMRYVESNRRIAVNEKAVAFVACARRALADDPRFARRALDSAFRTAEFYAGYGAEIAAQYQRMGDGEAAQAVLATVVSTPSPNGRLEVLWMIADAYRAAGLSFPPEVKQLLESLVSDQKTDGPQTNAENKTALRNAVLNRGGLAV